MLEIFWFDLIKYIFPLLGTLFFISVISFPVTNYFFYKNQDGGFIHAQTIGFLGIAWVSFVISTLITAIKLNSYLDLNLVSVLISIIIWLIFNTYISIKSGNLYDLYSFNKLISNFKSFTLTISITFICYFINSFNSLYSPSGAENHMNIGVLNSVIYSNQVPIKDFWLSGYNFNYYYFSQYSLGILADMLNFNPRHSFYFLGIIYQVLFLTSLLSLVRYITKNLLGSLTFIQNFICDTVAIFITLFISPLGSIYPLVLVLSGKENVENIFTSYADFSVRIIDNVIAENYNYSFSINPIHPVSNSLVVGILILNLLFNYLKTKKNFEFKNYNLILLFTMVGFAGLINTWDIVVYLGIIIFSVLYLQYEEIVKKPKTYFKNLIFLMYPIFIIMMPWYLFFESPAGVPGLVTNVSNLFQLLNFWGIYIILGIFLILNLNLIKDETKFIQILTVFGFLIILGLEIVYFRDALNDTEFYRANTYYKFSNLAILFFSVGSSIFLTTYLLRSRDFFLKIFITIIIVSTFWFNYIFLRVKAESGKIQYTGIISQDRRLQAYSSELIGIINYLSANKKSGDLLWEGGGEAYTNTNYISTFSGIPTIIGWLNHEYTWRNNLRQVKFVEEKSKETEEFFTGKDIEKKKELLKKNRVTYVVLGKSEREIYQEKLQSEIISQLGEVVYEENDTKLIKIIQ